MTTTTRETQPISRGQVRKAVGENDATLVEVLGEEQYEAFHLPGAINVPLGDDFEDRIQAAVPSRNDKVIVYCLDTQCSASAEAASRMAALGYENVCDYEGGKMDWKQAGLPIQN